jgi:hypothetical protein
MTAHEPATPLVRYTVFFVMKLKTRTVEVAGITCQPDEAWMTQIARNLTDARDGLRNAMPASVTIVCSALAVFGC